MSLKKLGILSAIIIGLGFLFVGWNHLPNRYSGSPLVGATNTKFVGALPTYLSGAGISSSVTSVGVLSLTIKQTGQVLQMSDFGTVGYATLEPGSSARQEFISFTGITQNSNGTAVLTGATRGLSTVYPYTASTTQQFAHGGGTTLIISNSPPFYNTFANQNNDATISGTYTFQSWALPGVAASTTDAQVSAATSTFATVNYVNNTTIAGAANATAGVRGIVQLATALQASSTSALGGGSTGASLVPATNIISATPGASLLVMAQSTGKILQGWLDLAASWTFSGGLSSTGATTIAGTTANPLTINGLAYKFTPTQAAASSSPLLTDGSGGLSWGAAIPEQLLCDITATSSSNNRVTCPVPSRKFYRIIYGIASTTASGSNVLLGFNNDVGNNYTVNSSVNGAASAPTLANPGIDFGAITATFVSRNLQIECWNEIVALKNCVGTSFAIQNVQVTGGSWDSSTTTVVSSITFGINTGFFGSGSHIRIFGSPD